MSYSSLSSYRKIVLLTEGFSSPFLGKTAINLLRYRTQDVVAVWDSELAGKTAEQVFGTGGSIPFIGSLDGIDADAVFVGIAPPGGKLPASWRPQVIDALRRRLDVVSGLHDFLVDDPEYRALAEASACRLIDVRKNQLRTTATHASFRPGCLRIHTVGHDCSVGKMVASLEIQRELVRRGRKAQFLATGQTGIMISGFGIPIDCVVADFVNGAAERLCLDHQDNDLLLIEGQGSIIHPAFSAVTLGLLHGCAPDAMIFVYEAGRHVVKSLEHVPIPPLAKLIDLYETMASVRNPSRVIGIAMNGRRLTHEEYAAEREKVEGELGLPVSDLYREGPGRLTDAVEKFQQDFYRCN